jgi:hypothetical protein
MKNKSGIKNEFKKFEEKKFSSKILRVSIFGVFLVLYCINRLLPLFHALAFHQTTD